MIVVTRMAKMGLDSLKELFFENPDMGTVIILLADSGMDQYADTVYYNMMGKNMVGEKNIITPVDTEGVGIFPSPRGCYFQKLYDYSTGVTAVACP